MNATMDGFQKILVATDFSPHAEAALRQGIWLARSTGAQLVLGHTLPDLRATVRHTSYQARIDLLYGSGELLQREIRQESAIKMRHMISQLGATDLDIKFETLLGEPFVELIHAVQKEGYDLVLAGTRGLSAWEGFLVGSTTKRLVRKCPSSVWVVKAEHVGCPKVVLATTDFSDVSRNAVHLAAWISRLSLAEFHLLHVIDASDVPEDVIQRLPQGGTLREAINAEARTKLEEFVKSLGVDSQTIQTHLSTGTPWQEIGRTAQHIGADLIAMGTVGRSGIQGILLGNTAERVLTTQDCSILTVKPDDFKSPIQPAFWQLHPDDQSTSPVGN